MTMALLSHEPLKTRRKSRYGCRNCKLRKLKCDEKKPCCRNCETFKVQCNFDKRIADLQPLSQDRYGTMTIASFRGTPSAPLRKPISSNFWISDGANTTFLGSQDQELFYHFRHRTACTLGGEEMADICDKYIFGDSFYHPFLMHAILASSSIHARYLHTPLTPDREAHHSSRCITLFNKALTSPISDAQKDALWTAAILVSIFAFVVPETSPSPNSTAAWPLNASSSSPLSWVRLKASDMPIWHLLNPTREESRFRDLARRLVPAPLALPAQGVHGIIAPLAALCGLYEFSTAASNAYFAFAHGVSQLLPQPRGSVDVGFAFMVIGAAPAYFQRDLEERRTVALVLLGLWYTRARECRWWIDCRARVEGPAICEYLRQREKGNGALEALLSRELRFEKE